MKIGFSGSRSGMTSAQEDAVARIAGRLLPTEAHHGDCQGADAQFHNIARLCTGAKVVSHPPDKVIMRAFCVATYTREPKPYLQRNRDIVDETDILIAAPKVATCPASLKGQGTWSTILYALGKRKPVYVVAPDGHVSTPVS